MYSTDAGQFFLQKNMHRITVYKHHIVLRSKGIYFSLLMGATFGESGKKKSNTNK